MPKNFMNVRFHAVEQGREELDKVVDRPRVVRGGARAVGKGAAPRTTFNDDEAAARFYLSRVLERDQRPAMRGLSAPERPELVPDMKVQETRDSPLTKTKLVRFEQTMSSVPVFGSQVVVEIDRKRQLVAVSGQLASVGQVNVIPSLSPKEALQSIAKAAGVEADTLEAPLPPVTTLYHDEEQDSWHLAYLFRQISAAPREAVESVQRGGWHSPGLSPRSKLLRVNYLVDAHDGAVLFYYSAAPTANMVYCRGLDELDVAQTFVGMPVDDAFELYDYARKIKTYDLGFQDVGTDIPAVAIRNATEDFEGAHRAAVSAHVNATRVFDFYKTVLLRDGVDGKAMELVSVINCTFSEGEPPPDWNNAMWWGNRMWYGQTRNGNGGFSSYARHLDIIAHELTHGVTLHTAGLVYRGQSGALDESYSDIFGVIISNWYNKGEDSDVGVWNWEVGPGLLDGTLPLRDMRQPSRCYNPADPERRPFPEKMEDYFHLGPTEDWGGVHYNSNIHNKAAYNVLNATDAAGRRAFSPRDVAVMYYLSLERLGGFADFAKAFQALVDAALTHYAKKSEEVRKEKVGYIVNAYEAVGLKLPPSE